MNEIKLSIEDKNLETVLTVLKSLNNDLIQDIEVTNTSTVDSSFSTAHEDHLDIADVSHISIDEKRTKLLSFASITLVILSVAAIYFEVYDKTYVPPFLRVFLASYWLYSLAGIIVSTRGSDYWVSKLYFNVSK